MEDANEMRLLWMVLGFLCLGLGTVGIVLPILPTVPFYMGTVFCFAKSSVKLHKWFLSTNLYKKHLECFVTNRMMTLKTKISIMAMVTVLMAVGFFMMKNVLIGRICLAGVWIFHLIYFSVRIKTIRLEVTYD